MAIDQDIEQRVNAYRSNPQALQQRYAQNQQLLDLLALQRLKSEKDDAARKVQMEMDQNPQTIKQQKEQQLLEMTKQDLAKQTAGIMQNAQKRQQKNMQRIAKQGAASPQQVQQVATGLGALAQRQQQQAPRRMAAGGIVALQAGGSVTQAEIEAYRQKLKKTNPRMAATVSDDRIRKILENSSTNAIRSSLDTAAEQAPQVETAPLEEKSEPTPTPVAPPVATQETPTAVEQPLPEPEAPPAPSQGILDVIQDPANKLTAPQMNTSGIAGVGLPSVDPEAARIRARDESSAYLGREEKANKMQQYLEELKALDVQQTDPKKMRDEQISAFLRGTAGRSGFGGTMAAGSGAMAAEREKQEKSQRDRLLSRIGIDQQAMTMDADLAKQALTDGRSDHEQSMAHQRTAAQVAAQVRGQDLRMVAEQAKLDYNANKDNVKNILDAFQTQYTKDLQASIDAADRSQRAAATLGQIQNDKYSFIMEYVGNDPDVLRAEQVALTNDDPQAAEAVRTARKLAELRAIGLIEASGILDKEASLRSIMGGNMPTSATSPSSGFTLSAEGQAALARNQ